MHVPKLFLTEPYSWKIKDIDLRPTYRYQAKCPTCGSWKRKAPDLSMAQTIQIVKYFRNLRKVIIEGGEPTLWEHLKYFIKCIDSEDKPVITNAINTKVIQNLSEYFTPNEMRWVVSLNGLGNVHDQSRGRKGAFNHLVESVDIMKNLKYDVRFQFMPTQKTIGDLEVTKEFIKERWGKSLILINYPSYAGIYGENVKSQYLDENEMRDLLTSGTGDSLLNRTMYNIYTDKAIKKEPIPCLYGRSKIHIKPDGGIASCQYEDTQLFGQVHDDKVVIGHKTRKNLCKHIIPDKCQYSTGVLCSHEAAIYGIRHNFFYLMREAWKRLI